MGALRAIVAYFEVEPGRLPPRGAKSTVSLHVDGEHVEDAIVEAAQAQPAVFAPFGERLPTGEHRVDIAVATGGASFLPYTVSVSYSTNVPQQLPGATCAVSLEVELMRSSLVEGECAEVHVRLANTTENDLPMICAIVGVPGGLAVQTEPLDELVKITEALSCYEIRGREVVLYFLGMRAGDRSGIELPVEVLAVTPGHFTGPASRAFLYYTDEVISWAAPLLAEVAVGDQEWDIVGT